MPWAKNKEKPKSYLITPGRDDARNELWDELDMICKKNETTFADEIWDALFTHVERYGDGKRMAEGPQPDFSMPDEGFDDVVANEAYDAQERVVEEILDEESREPRRVESGNIFGNTRYE